jgi:hypothetical protein
MTNRQERPGQGEIKMALPCAPQGVVPVPAHADTATLHVAPGTHRIARRGERPGGRRVQVASLPEALRQQGRRARITRKPLQSMWGLSFISFVYPLAAVPISSVD